MKISPILLLVLGSYTFAQNVSFDQVDRSILIRNGVFVEADKDSKVLGSQFLNDQYVEAEIIKAKTSVEAKYNAFKDEVEVLKEKKGFIIAKIPEYSILKFSPNNEFLELVTYTDENNNLIEGYLFQVAKKGAVSLYRREKITLEKAKSASSSYDSDVPAKYKKQQPKYFITAENGQIVQIPDNKKKIADLFPSKKETIEKFVKSNKINFSKQNEVINFFKIFN